jgi:hypothetical protein
MSGLHIEDLSLAFLTSPPTRHTKLLRMTRGTRREYKQTLDDGRTVVRHIVEPVVPWNTNTNTTNTEGKDMYSTPEIEMKWHGLFAQVKSFVCTMVFGPCAQSSFWDAERLAQLDSSTVMLNNKPATAATATTTATASSAASETTPATSSEATTSINVETPLASLSIS